MGRAIALTLGLLMLGFGALFTFQGLGYVGGSAMSGEDFWAMVGPIIAGFGVALLLVGARRRG